LQKQGEQPQAKASRDAAKEVCKLQIALCVWTVSPCVWAAHCTTRAATLRLPPYPARHSAHIDYNYFQAPAHRSKRPGPVKTQITAAGNKDVYGVGASRSHVILRPTRCGIVYEMPGARACPIPATTNPTNSGTIIATAATAAAAASPSTSACSPRPIAGAGHCCAASLAAHVPRRHKVDLRDRHDGPTGERRRSGRHVRGACVHVCV
jgi:hypothetical protein